MSNDRLAWPILLLLLTVLVPSVGVVWMMREAVRNERLASDQRLREAYEVQLQSAVTAVQDGWNKQLHRSAEIAEGHSASSAFAEIVSRRNVDAVLIRNGRGNIIYPESYVLSPLHNENSNPLWNKAQSQEFAEREFTKAAETYARLSTESPHEVLRAKAKRAQARCLLQSGRNDLAIEVLQSQRHQPTLRDHDGRSFAASAELRLLELLDQKSNQWQEVATALFDRLGDYRGDTLTSSQRIFLMNQVQAVAGESVRWPTFDAETLANQASLVGDIRVSTPRLQSTSLPEIWCRATDNGRVVELYRTATVHRRLIDLAQGLPLPRGVTFVAMPPNELSGNLMDASLGVDFSGWRLGLSATQSDLFDKGSQQRQAVHVWIALLVVAVTCVLAWLLFGALRQRLQLAQLKNDLVATVSHELKTPLASIRLLVDTLIENEDKPKNDQSDVQLGEYLQLISQENARLTRLIDNFLTFSRMERGKDKHNFQNVDIRDLVEQGTAVFCEHMGNLEGCLTIDDGPPAWISGDVDSLVTAVVNLLENAWKYSNEPRRISVSTLVNDKRVMLRVRDNGIGMSAREVSQAFDRFFQVDQRVARTRGGCGLGLSIVRAIMQSHGGEVHVESEPEMGSTFTLCFPKPVEVTS